MKSGATLDPETETAFFSGLKMRNGTFKETSPSRFAEMEATLAAALTSDADKIKRALDVGMSNGQTTAEFADFLSGAGISAALTGTDLFIDAHLIDLGSDLYVLTDAQGWPLQYDFKGRAIRAWTRRLDYLTLAAIPRAVARKTLRNALVRKITRAETRPIKMVCQALKERKIAWVENDILVRTKAFEARFDFIRAANILNKGYFPVEDLRKAVANIKAYSTGPGALLLVVRTTNDENHGTLFKLKADTGYEVVTRFGEGSEIETLVLTQGSASELD